VIRNIISQLKIEKNLMDFMNVYYVLAVQHLAHPIGGILKSTLDQRS